MSDSCPICDPPESCRGYPHLWRRMRESPARWAAVHDMKNGRIPENHAIKTPAITRDDAPDLWLPRIRACPDYNPGCCAHPAPYCSRFNISPTRDQCIECLEADPMNPALNLMKAPGSKRPQIWRNGIIQIMITRACDLSCHHCTQGSNLAGKPAMMTCEQFAQACDSLQGYFGVVGMFGGNPTMHPEFSQLCRIMRDKIPFLQRGLWCNNLRGRGADARITFNPKHSNINVHLDSEAAEEFRRDWPESAKHIKGETTDSVHSSPWVSMKDLGIPEEKRWELISKCDINQNWSALIGVFRGNLRAYFCEVAYSQAALHEHNPNWDGTGQPMIDRGLEVKPGWWKQGMAAFQDQVNQHCHHCGIPMRRDGQYAIGGEFEEFSETHQWIARTKIRDRPVQLVTIGGGQRSERPATEYLAGVTPGYKQHDQISMRVL